MTGPQGPSGMANDISCTADAYVRAVVSGNATCGMSRVYTAGAGLQLASSEFSIRNGSITSAMIAPGAVTNVSIAQGSLNITSLSQSGCSVNETLAWNGSAWACATVSGAGGGFTGATCAYGSVLVGIDAAGGPICAVEQASRVASAPRATTHTNLEPNSTGQSGFKPALTIGADGLPIAVYVATAGSANVLRVAHCRDVGCTSASVAVVDPNVHLGTFSSIAIGADGLPIIAYIAGPGWPYTHELRVAKCGTKDCSNATITVLEQTASLTRAIGIAIGSDGMPIIAYMHTGGESAPLHVAKCTNAACSTGTMIVPIEQPGSYGVSGNTLSLAIGSNGRPIIAYWAASPDGYRLMVLNCSTNCTDAGVYDVTGTETGSSPNIGMAIGADGFPIIVYARPLGLRVVKCVDVICEQEVTLSIAGNDTDAELPSIAIATDGMPTMTYYLPALGGRFMYLRCSTIDCAGPVTRHLVDRAREAHNAALAFGADGLPIVVYGGATSWPSDSTLWVTHFSNIWGLDHWWKRG